MAIWQYGYIYHHLGAHNKLALFAPPAIDGQDYTIDGQLYTSGKGGTTSNCIMTAIMPMTVKTLDHLGGNSDCKRRRRHELRNKGSD